MIELLDKDLIMLNSNANTYSEVFHQLGSVMIEKGYANNDYTEGLLNRESEYPTGIPVEPVGVAIPHTDSSFVNSSKIGLMTLENPVEFGVMGGRDSEKINVKLVILLGFADGKHHLKALQNIIQLIQDSSFVEGLLSVNSREEAYHILENKLELEIEEEL
ncbi:PTS sugar transporter subunit IIA [Metabacillus sp. Hm71]|uniref:PTS sugar transporter subunit IIA n=1 Tax=Metabacillus sp. Hm71 TaxID=3450743 RepID=UPI003F43C23F